ncbi:hypothetical protein AAC387_Pa08g2213 [Persea americana]
MNALQESQNRESLIGQEEGKEASVAPISERVGIERNLSLDWVFSHFLLPATERDDRDLLVLLSEQERRRVKRSSDEEERKSVERAGVNEM